MNTAFLYGLRTRIYLYTPGLSMLSGCMWVSPNAQRGLGLAMIDQCLDDESMDMTLLSGPAERTEPVADLDAAPVVQDPTQGVQQDLNFKFRKDSALNRTESGQDKVPKGIPIFKNKARSFINDYNRISNARARKKEIASVYANACPDIRLAKVNQALAQEGISIFKNKKSLYSFLNYHNIYSNTRARKREIVSAYVNECPDTRLAKVNQTLAQAGIATFENKDTLHAFINDHNIHFYTRARKGEIVSAYANEPADTRLTQVNQALAQERIPTFENRASLTWFMSHHKIRSQKRM